MDNYIYQGSVTYLNTTLEVYSNSYKDALISLLKACNELYNQKQGVEISYNDFMKLQIYDFLLNEIVMKKIQLNVISKNNDFAYYEY